ncbi:penicillin-binding protein [Streptomyces sp. NBC_00237]|uniref:transglycosylase domain-containing protein n=1 Tax=Streptomyces sp. NBC_00237 TaxID=2975687 RepID=UPI0022596DDF|nr:transglycosylase domain-containing protein [Streptomyces sp. NBC_00237]MCX5205313.1 penicillin-binding protein [Streptomyces sp. NBC_00237]
MARRPNRPTRLRGLLRRPRPGSRRVDYPRRGKTGWRRWVPSWRQTGSGALLGLAVLAGLFGVVYASVDIPDENAEARQQGTVYYWADGSQMVSVGTVNRQNVTLAEIPDAMEHAVIAAENETFYDDSGVSLKGIARAAVSIVKGGDTQGGSTITQQYVKNTYLSQEQTATRKLREFVISLKLSNERSKEEILQGYLNTSWFGRGANGIQAAAQAYYGVPAKDLDPSQAALLAALLKGAEEYDPAGGGGNHARAVERWKWILDRQVETGTMTQAERNTYLEFPEPRKTAKPTSLGGQTGYLVDIANKYIKKRSGLTDKDLARGGYKVHTTFDKAKVHLLEKSVRTVRERDLDPGKREEDKHVEIGAASVRADGAVVAVYGGADAITRFTNNADTAGVPVGSAFKPFVAAAGLQHGDGITMDSGYDAQGRLVMIPAGGGAVTPPGVTPGGAGASGPTTLRDALVASGNATFVQLGKQVGLKKVKEFAVKAGLHEASLARLDKSFVLGTSTPSAVRMADAYTAFTNEGMRSDPYSVTEMTRDGEPVEDFEKPVAQRVMNAEVAREVNNTLSVVAWTKLAQNQLFNSSGGFAAPGNLSAGATGPNDRMRSAWFIGHSQGLTTAVTMFRTKPDAPQLLGMQGVGGPGSQHGTVFPVRIWSAYATGK